MRNYPVQFWFLMIACLINSMVQMATVFISLFLHNNKVSVEIVGILISLFGLGGLIGSFSGGVISDHISSINVVRVSLIINAILLFMFPLFHNLFIISCLLLLMGVANSTFRPASLLLILSFDRINKPSIIMSYRRVFVNLGTSLGTMVSGIIFNHDPSIMFKFYSFFLLFSFITVSFIKTIDNIESIDYMTVTIKNYNKKIYLPICLLALSLIIYYQQNAIYTIYLIDNFFLSSTDLALMFALNGVLVVLCQIPLTYLLKNISPYKISAFGSLLMGIGFSIIIINGGYKIGMLSVFIWSLGELLLFPSVLDILLIQNINSKRGKLMGLYQTAFSFSYLLAPVLGTFCYKINIYFIWILCFIFGVISFIGFLYIGNKS
jgi:predicted MFS family arabinose efflux permease